jgi:RNA polymerase sigma factor (sigma-70 family)
MCPNLLRCFPVEAGPWFETEEAIDAGLAWGAEKARLLDWVENTMATRLTKRERACLKMYYFDDLNFRQIGERTQTNASSVYRAVSRGLRKIRKAVAESPPR